MSDTLQFRIAQERDLYDILRLIAQDQLGSKRETLSNPPSKAYIDAFKDMQSQKDNNFIIALQGDRIVGCYQFTLIYGISRGGAPRAQIESVRVDQSLRGSGIGRKMMLDAIDRAKKSNCQLVQLTTDKTRDDAHRFYDNLDFTASHIGYKMKI
ncbi:GNAT family N-acetyltransferase [Sneathiella marina]|uniref:GNAT family N-acetyltransferase n=1 Tax=Sneathiella marina TaxID=2950108 RepID=A0ABY4VY54_9PROT|nr:GNAT family N-acetyltransferase [Sneathiella marina]USG59564.1 GNAT family N-acetyltransferase [Sneathiella marina]